MDHARPLEETAEAEPNAVAAERLTFFGDAVIAIAITLLALELPVPEGLTTHQVLDQLSEARGEYIAFLISFVVIGAHWGGHHRVFRHVDRTRGPLTLLTLGWLLMQILTPFTTKVLSADGAFAFRFILYASVQALAGLFFMLMVRQVQAHGLYRPGTPPDLFRRAYFGQGSLALGFLLSIPAVFLVEDRAYNFWFGVPVATALVRRILRKRREAAATRQPERP
ncbi:DUF1211 domain-containing protein [Couchioplanes caeruleus]|uniref:TMEM175 family protein n=1 Tax=Couchioplanes caeruleus TaxID=56438 RepID=UPI0020C0717E|nr:TMEM175 family protein [Couchioplanes caeruleus]UQU62094.1 DUF1211 domain-containing protein [Couchioplanes caeruleus]